VGRSSSEQSFEALVDDKPQYQKMKNRRALRKNKRKLCEKKLVLVGVNSAGLTYKL
jgi:hypothetical protein